MFDFSQINGWEKFNLPERFKPTFDRENGIIKIAGFTYKVTKSGTLEIIGVIEPYPLTNSWVAMALSPWNWSTINGGAA